MQSQFIIAKCLRNMIKYRQSIIFLKFLSMGHNVPSIFLENFSQKSQCFKNSMKLAERFLRVFTEERPSA